MARVVNERQQGPDGREYEVDCNGLPLAPSVRWLEPCPRCGRYRFEYEGEEDHCLQASPPTV